MGPVWHWGNPGARPHRSPFSLSSIFWEVLHREVVMFSSDCRWSVGKRILHQVSMWWVSYPMIEIRNYSGTCWKIEGLKQVGVGFFFGIQVSFVTSRCDGWEEESFPVWGTNTGQTDRLINSFDQENWRRLWRQQNNYWLSSSPVRLRFMASTCCSVHQMKERLCSIHLQRSLNYSVPDCVVPASFIWSHQKQRAWVQMLG